MAVNNVVMLESNIELLAKAYPFFTASLTPRPIDSSSFILSLMRTLASIAILSVKTSPTSPVNVNTELIATNPVKMKIKFKNNAKLTMIPHLL